ncbi:MAG: branched-chain amino acid ABC transporter permease [Nitrososphaerota archaeon]
MIAFLLDTFIWIALYSILALSLSIEYGFTGIVNFGKALFFMIGAYVSAIVTLNGLNYFVGLLFAILFSALIGLISSIPMIKVKEDYFAIITLALSECIRIILKNEYWIAGGPIGLKNIPSAFPLKNLSYEIFLILNLFLVIGILLSFHLIVKILTNSPYGRILKAIREDETLTQILGKNTFKYKAQIFIIGSAMAGAAGSFLSQYVGYISTDLFLSTTTFTIWIMCIIGGPSNINGAIIGAFIMRGIERGTRILKDYTNIPIDPNNFMFIITGILMVLFIMYKPEGIMKEKRMKVE